MRRVVIVMSLMLLGQQAATAAEPVLPDQPDPMPSPRSRAARARGTMPTRACCCRIDASRSRGWQGSPTLPSPSTAASSTSTCCRRRWIRVGLETELGRGNTGRGRRRREPLVRARRVHGRHPVPRPHHAFVEGRVAVGALGGTFRAGTTFTARRRPPRATAPRTSSTSGSRGGHRRLHPGRAFVSISLGWAHPVYFRRGRRRPRRQQHAAAAAARRRHLHVQGGSGHLGTAGSSRRSRRSGPVDRRALGRCPPRTGEWRVSPQAVRLWARGGPGGPAAGTRSKHGGL